MWDFVGEKLVVDEAEEKEEETKKGETEKKKDLEKKVKDLEEKETDCFYGRTIGFSS